MLPPESITLIERYGSFGLLCVIALATLTAIGWGAWYMTTRLIPRVFSHLDAERAERETQRSLFATELEKRDEAQQKMHEECQKTARQTAEVLGALVAEVKSLSGDTHREPRRRAGS